MSAALSDIKRAWTEVVRALQVLGEESPDLQGEAVYARAVSVLNKFTEFLAALEAKKPLAEVDGRIVRQKVGGCVLLAVGFGVTCGLKPGEGRDVRVIILEEAAR